MAGPPGSGKTTYLEALLKILSRLGIKVIFIQAKNCKSQEKIEFRGASKLIVKRVSSILQFTTSEGFKSSFDLLSTAECDDLDCLIEFVNKKYKSDVAVWVEPRLKMLKKFVKDDVVVIPTCLSEEDDELMRRLIVGILYVLRSKTNAPIILDDLTSYVVNIIYSEAFAAMMRPYKLSKNKDLTSDEILMYNPVVIAPGSHGGFYRLAHPDKYVILFDGNKWTVPRKDIEKIAYS